MFAAGTILSGCSSPEQSVRASGFPGSFLLLVLGKETGVTLSDEDSFYWRVRMRSGSLRMLGGTHYDVQVPLPRLPASDRRWICPGTGCAFVSISCDERPTAVPLHPEHGRR